jgi:hypothetical protein
MKRIIYSLLFSFIMIAGIFIGVIKGQEVRNKWVSKMKFRYEERKDSKKQQALPGEIALDEIEEATYHS